jgi:hypothetical protein
MRFEAACVLMALVILVLSIVFTTHENDACKANGGVLVKAPMGYECVAQVSK